MTPAAETDDPVSWSAWQPLGEHWGTAEPDSGVSRGVREVRYGLSRDGSRLVWEMRLPRPLRERQDFATEGFTPGLWNLDVAECFVAEAASGRYTEYNLGPGGAWWAAVFQVPRQAEAVQPAPDTFGVRCSTVWEADHWLARLSLPMPCAPENARVNFTAVAAPGPASGGEARGTDRDLRYYSLAPLTAAAPDFHLPRQWLALLPAARDL